MRRIAPCAEQVVKWHEPGEFFGAAARAGDWWRREFPDISARHAWSVLDAWDKPLRSVQSLGLLSVSQSFELDSAHETSHARGASGEMLSPRIRGR